MATTKGSIKRAATFTEEEQAAMAERAKEMKAAKGGKVDGEQDLLAKVAELPEPDRAMATRIHAIVKEAAPSLESRTWYGMPAYAKGGKVICFFQAASKFKVRYATVGFQPDAALDDDTMWATSWAILELTPANEARLADLVRKAAG